MPDASELASQVLTGNVRSASRLISLIERDEAEATAAVAALFSATGSARTIGVTGPPGAGKSTLIKELIAGYRERRLRVGVLAVDPSSHATGGALLGDRLRMTSPAVSEAVFIRSMAVRDQQGGIALATTQAMRVLDAMGCDRLIVETVGVGQSEIAVARTVDCTVLVVHPGAGDEIQAMKSGIMEIGDVYVINKSDQPGADHLRRQLLSATHFLTPRDLPRHVLMVSARTGDGVAGLIEVLESRFGDLETSGLLQRQRLVNLEHEVVQLVLSKTAEDTLAALGPEPAASYAVELEQRSLDPSAVASLLLAQLHLPRERGEPSGSVHTTEGAA